MEKIEYIEYREAVVQECFELREESDIYSLRLIWGGDLKIKLGQFIALERLDESNIWPRPFSMYKKSTNTITVLIKVVGPNTMRYSELRSGHKIKVTGPLGQPMIIEARAEKYILVAGGIGIAGLLPISQELQARKIPTSLLFGAADSSQIVGLDDFIDSGCEVNIITDEHGPVTDLLEKELKQDNGRSIIVACGPKPMLKKVADLAKENGNKCLVMLEELMACGTGSCDGCAVSVTDNDGQEEIKHVCSDGVVFDASRINWDKFLPWPVVKLPEIEKRVDNPMRVVLKGQEGRKLVLEYPFMNASGCLGTKEIESSPSHIKYLGALVTKGITRKFEIGNPSPRIYETPSGMLNSIGLENVGIKRFIKEKLPIWLSFGKSIIVNIAGSAIAEYVYNAERLADSEASAFEINVSCPNVKEGGMAFGVSQEAVAEVVGKIRKIAPEKFIIVKLTPNVTDIVSIADAAKQAGADAISLINTITGMAIDIETWRPRLGKIYGGLSGPAIRPIALFKVWEVAQANLGIPIIGMGGIDSWQTGVQFFLAGASAISMGTGSFTDYDIFSEIHDGILEYMAEKNVSQISDMVGKMITS